MRLIAMMALLFFWSPAVGAQETRLALVIGNSKYETAPLTNPVNDARLMASTFRNLGFRVIERLNVTQRELKRAINEFGDLLDQAGRETVGVFYYAGHGIQVAGKNFMVPVDAEISREKDVFVEGVNVDGVLRAMEFARNQTNFIILDACRNNPYSRSFRSSSAGLAQLNAPNGSLIAYATGPGDVAADGGGRNSPYTLALVEAMKVPRVVVESMFRLVRNKVSDATRNRQTPWVSSSLGGGDFYFNLGIANASPTIVPPIKNPATPVRPVAAKVVPAREQGLPKSHSLQINYVYRTPGNGSFKPLTDNARLKSGDQYKIIFTPDNRSYVYIFQVDSAGNLFRLFPMRKYGKLALNNVNPVNATRTYSLPAEDKAFRLDDTTGLERIYFVASSTANQEIENLSTELSRGRSSGDTRSVETAQAKLKRLFSRRGEQTEVRNDFTEVAWRQEGEVFTVLAQRLKNLCEGCSHVIEFIHE